MWKHRTVRVLALSFISLGIAVAVCAMEMRESDAETPPQVAPPAAAGTLNPYILAEAKPIEAEQASNRIRFGSVAASESPDSEHSCGPNCQDHAHRSPAAMRQQTDVNAQVSADAYPVRQAAAEVPFGTRGTPTPAPPRTPTAPLNAPPPMTQAPSPYAAAPSAAPSATASTGDRYGAAATTASRAPFPSTPLPANPLPTQAMPSNPLPTAATATSGPAPLPKATPAPTAAFAAPANPPARASQPTVSQPIVSQPIVSQPAAASASASGVSGVGRPGEKALEGAQAPTLVIEKFAPAEIQVGKPALFEIVVRNTGVATATNVEVHDVVPHGTQLISSNPQAAQARPGELAWLLGPMGPGDEATLQLELMPMTEGEIGSVATVHFTAAASARTICTKPELAIEVQAPRTVMLGDEVPLKIRVFNPGTGVATGIYLTEVVPSNMEHEAGGELEYEVGDLQPNETRELDLTLRAVAQGAATNVIRGKGDGRLASETTTQLEVVAPALAVAIDGPKRRFLDRQATYTVSLSNPGTAAAREVELATYLPQGMQFIDADNQGEYDEATHSVRWLLEELPPRQQGSVSLTALPIEPGQQVLRVESTADRGVSAKKEEAILVEGASSIAFQVVDSVDPVEVGGEVEYEIIVANQGSKEATNVQLRVSLPEGMKTLDADGPAKFTSNGRQVQFQALPQLPAKSETSFRVKAQCTAAGDHRCHVELLADDMKLPVTKEEGTRVYADE